MEAFSLLKYWRGGGGVFTRDKPSSIRSTDSSTSSSATTTIITAVSPSSSSESDSDGGDDGPFFDLEFTLPEEDEDSDSEDQIKESKDLDPNIVQEPEDMNDRENVRESENDDGGVRDGEEIKFTLSSSSSGDSNEYDPNITLSPSDDLFFTGHLVPIDSSSSMILTDSEALPKFPSQVSSVLKSSATKFRVHMLKFNKSKSNLREKSQKSEPDEKHENQERKQQNKVLTVKLKVEAVPFVPLFTRDTSKSIKRNASSNDSIAENTGLSGAAGVMHKYLKKVKPLYIRVSKKYGDKLRFSGQLSFPKSGAHPPPPSEVKSPAEKCSATKGGGAEGGEVAGEVVGENNIVKGCQKPGNLQAGLRVVCKHLGKSRSASLSLATAPAPAGAPAAPVASKRRDDSLLQQQDGIQSAILHCKRSFNASRDLEASIPSRSVSDPSHEEVAS